jgi:twitching motility protein PilT
MHINDLLKIAVERRASDLHLKVGAFPILRVDGVLKPMSEMRRIVQEDTMAMAFSIMSARQKEKFKTDFEIDASYQVPNLGRFRCSVFQQRGTVGLVLRVIPTRILTIRELLLPPVLEKICMEQRGLVLCTGTTGSGKTTTLASMVDHVNTLRNEHIMTIEDPIEYLPATRSRSSTSASSTWIRKASPSPSAAPCARIPTSSSSGKCATPRRSGRP